MTTDPRQHDVHPLDRISIKMVAPRCIIGTYDWERTTAQSVTAEVDLFLDTRRAAASEDLSLTVDYGRLASELRFILEVCQFTLLETACAALSHYVLVPPLAGSRQARVAAVSVRLAKAGTNGLLNSAVKVVRNSDSMNYKVEDREFGKVDNVFVSRRCGVYRLRIGPGRAIPTHVHRTMDEAEMVLSDGLHLQGEIVRGGTVCKWPKEFPHRYDNPSATEEKAVLCINRPPFDPADEIVVAEAPAPLSRLETANYYDMASQGSRTGTPDGQGAVS